MKIKVRDVSRVAVLVFMVLAGVILVVQPGAGASVQSQVDLGTAGAVAVLGGQTVTNTGPSVINGDLAVSPGSAITGFPPGILNGTLHAADAVAAQAQADLTIAYNDAAGRASDLNLSGQDLGGLTLSPGVYKFDTVSQLTGTLTLDAQGNPEAVFIFQIGSALTTATNSAVSLINGAQACHVFWQVGSSATLGTTTTFLGSVLALTSITAVTGTNVDGRLLARNGAVTLDTNVVTRATCAVVPPPTTTVPAGSPTTTAPAGSPTMTVPFTAPTTVPGGGTTATVPAHAIPAPANGAGAATTAMMPSTTTTVAGTASNSTSTGTRLPLSGVAAAASPGTTSGTPLELPRTGSRFPLVGLALGILLLVTGALELQTAGRRSQPKGILRTDSRD